MKYHVVEARHVSGHVVWLRFRHGTTGEIDLASALEGPIFEPLRDPRFSSSSRFILSFTRSSGPTARTLPQSSCTTTSE